MTRRRLSILHVIGRLNVGGAARHVLELAREQLDRGHEVLVVAGTLAAGETSMEYLARELDVEVRPLPALQRELSPLGDGRATLELRRLLRERRPEILHTHTAKAGGTGRLAARTAGRARPRVVHTFHGHVLSGYFSRRREHIFRRLEYVLSYATDQLVAVSDEVRDDLVRFGVARPERVAVVPYGFRLREWSAEDDAARTRIRSDLALPDGTFAIGFAGRLTAIKRPLDLVRTLAEVRRRDVDATLVLVGDGEERAATEALARELHVDEHCRFVGYQERIRDWYAAVDAALLTSANEGTPVVAIEALAADRPVVATRAGGTSTVVRDGETGYLLPIGDIPALAERLTGLARDPELRSRLGRAGGADVRVRFATERMADELEALYLGLLR
jgi:glycosyltransferase involved in cell wall biosynthesis